MSRYVRLRDLDDSGKLTCSTCGRRMDPEEAQNGHYIPRQHKATRWLEKNTAPQCPKCNDYEGGEQHLMGLYLDRKYGFGTAAWLQGMKHTIYKSYPSVIAEIGENYKNRALQLISERCVRQWWGQ